MKPIALITGATSGIGEATARVLADTYSLILCGRRAERLKSLSKELQIKTDVITLQFDVRNQKDIGSEISSLPDTWKTIDVLINNAGNAHGMSTIQDGDTDDWDAMIDINVKGLLYMTHEVLPGMINRQKGHIINIGSVAGVDVYRQGNVYNASKFAVDSLSKGMRMDLIDQGIKVSEIKPGLVQTEFSEVRFKGDKEKSTKPYEGVDALQAVDIAETIAFILSRPAHVNVADVLVLASAQASATMIDRK